MKNRFITVFLVSVLVLSVAFGTLFGTVGFVDLAKGVEVIELPTITINRDGTVTPETTLLTRDGNVYTLTGDVDGYGFVINCDDVVFDGAGHMIDTTAGHTPSISFATVTNVTVKNVETVGSHTSIHVYYSCNCLLENVTTNNRVYLPVSHDNTITKSNIARLSLADANNNVIKKNTIQEYIWISGSNNIIYQNNIFTEESDLAFSSGNFLDNGSIGNYWSIYNGTDNNGDGIGDTPIVVFHYFPSSGNGTCTDNYPLMEPIDTTTGHVPEFSSWTILPFFVIGILLVALYRKRCL